MLTAIATFGPPTCLEQVSQRPDPYLSYLSCSSLASSLSILSARHSQPPAAAMREERLVDSFRTCEGARMVPENL